MATSTAQILELAQKILGPEKTAQLVTDMLRRRGLADDEESQDDYQLPLLPSKPLSRSHVDAIDRVVADARAEIVPAERLGLHTDLVNWLRTRADPAVGMATLVSALADVAAMSARNGQDAEEERPHFEVVVGRMVEEFVTLANDFRDLYVGTAVTTGRD